MLWEFVISWDNLKNVVISTQRDNSREYQEYITLQNFGSGVFFYVNCDRINIILVDY